MLFFVLAGCYHATLDPVPATASSEQRLAAYQRLRPAAQVENITVTSSRYGYGTNVNVSTEMVLGDGTTVTNAEDLVPVLDPETPAARAAKRSASARHDKWTWILGGLAAIAAGGVMIALDASTTDRSQDGADRSNHVLTILGLATAFGGTLAVTISPFYFGSIEAREDRAAFFTYDASLQQTLRLCAVGLQITDCAAQPSPQTPPSQAQAAR